MCWLLVYTSRVYSYYVEKKSDGDFDAGLCMNKYMLFGLCYL